MSSDLCPVARSIMASKYNFVSEPEDELVCLICLEVAEEPWQHGKCGRLLCKKCLEALGTHKPCPNCRESQPQYFEDNRSKRNIRILQVNCANVDSGCVWVGTVATLDEHVAKCEFTPLPCPKQCLGLFTRKDLDRHLEEDCPNRDYACKYCGEKGTYAHIMEAHDKLCQEKVSLCPNDGCTVSVHRQHVENHVTTECGYAVIPCKFKGLGCKTELKRKDMAAHEEDAKLHLHMAIDTMARLEKELRDETAKLKKGLEDASNRIDALEKSGTSPKQDNLITFELTNFQKKRRNKTLYYSPTFYTSHKGYCLHILVYANGHDLIAGTHVSVFVVFRKGSNDNKLRWPFVGDVKITLLNQLEDKNHYSKVLDISSECNIRSDGGNDNWGYPEFIRHSELGYDPGTNTQYLKDDTLYFRVSVDVGNHKPWLECSTKYMLP